MNTTGRAARGRTDTQAQACPFGPGRCAQQGRHDHDYEVDTRFGTRRCSCGSRHYLIATGGPITARVVCARCRKENYPATCYEAGRARGPRKAEDPDAPPAF